MSGRSRRDTETQKVPSLPVLSPSETWALDCARSKLLKISSQKNRDVHFPSTGREDEKTGNENDIVFLSGLCYSSEGFRRIKRYMGISYGAVRLTSNLNCHYEIKNTIRGFTLWPRNTSAISALHPVVNRRDNSTSVAVVKVAEAGRTLTVSTSQSPREKQALGDSAKCAGIADPLPKGKLFVFWSVCQCVCQCVPALVTNAKRGLDGLFW